MGLNRDVSAGQNDSDLQPAGGRNYAREEGGQWHGGGWLDCFGKSMLEQRGGGPDGDLVDRYDVIHVGLDCGESEVPEGAT